jgi:2,3-bisphosphoglycerate-dependent phosphoglycerate mutase
MSQLILIRHSECLSQTIDEGEEILVDEDDALSGKGHIQAQLLADHLPRMFSPVQIVTSPIRRALETAKYLGEAYEMIPVIDARLAERNFAFPRGTTRIQSRLFQEKSYKHPQDFFPGGESLAQHRIRTAGWLDEVKSLIGESSNDTLIAVTHGGTIEHVQGCLLGTPLSFMAKVCTACDVSHYNLWTTFRTNDQRLVWRLEGVNLASGMPSSATHI